MTNTGLSGNFGSQVLSVQSAEAQGVLGQFAAMASTNKLDAPRPGADADIPAAQPGGLA